MATAHLPEDVPMGLLPEDLPEVPAAWVETTDRTGPQERTAWVHRTTGLRVRVRTDSRPTQMHTPETSTTDRGYVAEVRDDVTGLLSHGLGSKAAAYESAIRFMAAYPDGEFDLPLPGEQPPMGEPVEWSP